MTSPESEAIVRREFDRDRRRGFRLLKIAGGIFLLIFVILLLIGPWLADRSRSGETGSSFGVRPGGFRGLFETLTLLGYDTERWARSYGALVQPRGSVLVMLDPLPEAMIEDVAHTARMAELLARWVKRGGNLIYAPPGRRVANLFGIDVYADDRHLERLLNDMPSLVEGDLLSDLPARRDHLSVGPVRGDHDLSALVTHFGLLPERVLPGLRPYLAVGLEVEGMPREPLMKLFEEPDGSEWQVLARMHHKPLVLAREIGEGKVFVFPSAYPFANGAVRYGGTAHLVAEVAALATDGGQRRLLFDEYCHGLVSGRDMLRWAKDTPLGRVAVSALLLIAVAAWFGAVRFGAPRLPREVPRRAKEEFVLSLADLYRRAGRHRMAGVALVHGLSEELARQRGLDVATAEPPEELRPALQSLKDRPPRRDSELLRLARAATDAYRRAVDRIRGTKHTKDRS